MHPKPNVVIAALLALALVISLSLVAGCRHGAGRGVDATASLSGTDLAIGSLRNKLNFETALSSATGAADTVEADAEITRTAGNADNAESPDLAAFRASGEYADVQCAPRRPTKYALAYERSLLMPGATEQSSLQRDDDFVCEHQRMWFTLEQALPDGQLLALGAGSLLMTNATGLVMATYHETKGWQLGATIAPIAIPTTSSSAPIAAYDDFAGADEYVALTRPGHVAVIRQRATTAAPAPTAAPTTPASPASPAAPPRNPVATYAWVVDDVITDPNPRDPSPPSSLHLASGHLLWWSSSKNRGYIFERNPEGKYIYVQALHLPVPLLATGSSRVLGMAAHRISIQARQSSRAPDMLLLFGRYQGNRAHAESDLVWSYEAKFELSFDGIEFVDGVGSDDGLVLARNFTGSDTHYLKVFNAQASGSVQTIEYLTRAVPVAVTKDVLILDCTDDREDESTCLLVRNIHDRFETYSNIVGVRPLAYRDRVLIGRDLAGPGGTARLVVLRH